MFGGQFMAVIMNSALGPEIQFKAMCEQAASRIQAWFRLKLEERGLVVPPDPKRKRFGGVRKARASRTLV